MAREHLKCGKTIQEKQETDAKVEETVNDILTNICTRKDEVVRELSHKFDN